MPEMNDKELDLLLADLPTVKAPAGFSDKVMARIQKGKKKARQKAFFSAFASVACVLVLGVVFFARFGLAKGSNTPQAPAEMCPDSATSYGSLSFNGLSDKNGYQEEAAPCSESAWESYAKAYIAEHRLPEDTTYELTEDAIVFFNAKGEEIARVDLASEFISQ